MKNVILARDMSFGKKGDKFKYFQIGKKAVYQMLDNITIDFTIPEADLQTFVNLGIVEIIEEFTPEQHKIGDVILAYLDWCRCRDTRPDSRSAVVKYLLENVK